MKTNSEGLRIIKKFGAKIPVEDAEAMVLSSVSIPLTDNQFSALVSFVCCRGAHSFGRSCLLKYVNSADPFRAARQFGLWVNQGGKRRKSLVRRRALEEKLFLKPVLVAG